MADDEIAIRVEHVSKNFVLPHEKISSVKGLFTNLAKGKSRKSKETQHALRDINFEIKKGEFFGIVGRNGSGKSTLLKILANIYQPTKGKIYTKGKLVPFIELGVGFNPELTGRENVYLNGAMMGFSEKRVDSMYDDIVAFAELEQFMDQKLKNYSSGMQVRLAFSVAVKADMDILLVDEVLAVGDADFQRKCYEYFRSLKRNKKTVIFVSHDMGAVQQFCDRALLINDSKVVEEGTPARIAMLYGKLFMEQLNEQKKKSNLSSGEERWGDGWGRWTNVSVRQKRHKVSGETEYLEVVARGVAEKKIEIPIFGFSVKNDEFVQILGTNTVRKNIKIDPLQKGDEFSVTWHMPNIFSERRYFVDCTIAHDQATTVSDRWPDAASFEIKRLEKNPYPMVVDAGFKVVVNGESKEE